MERWMDRRMDGWIERWKEGRRREEERGRKEEGGRKKEEGRKERRKGGRKQDAACYFRKTSIEN